MNKRETFQKMWIEIAKRRPPDTDEKILIWNPETGWIRETSGRVLNVQHDQLRNVPGMLEKIEHDPLKKFLDGYFATHWMRRWGPDA